METVLIIPLYKQNKYWIRMMSGIEQQTVLPKFVFVMMDRPTNEEYTYIKKLCSSEGLRNKYRVFNLQKIPEYVGRPNNLPDHDLFLTGNNRNIGINEGIKEGCENFVFIDGDCIPEPDLIKSHSEINSIGIPSITCGKRKEKQYNWRDQRELDPNLKDLQLFGHKNGFIIQNAELLRLSSVIWTCNVGINLKAVKLIKKLNLKYYGREEVFSSEFLGSWGGEDSFLGIQGNMCKIFINTLCKGKSGIRHIEHERPIDKYGENSFGLVLKYQVELLNLMQINNPLDMEFFREY